MKRDRYTLKQLVGQRMCLILEEMWGTWFAEYPGPQRAEIMRVGLQDLIRRMADQERDIEFKVLMPGVVREIVEEFLTGKGQ